MVVSPVGVWRGCKAILITPIRDEVNNTLPSNDVGGTINLLQTVLQSTASAATDTASLIVCHSV